MVNFCKQLQTICKVLGCYQCGREKAGWTKHDFIKQCQKNNGIGTLYILKCFNENETFYKIGITSVSIKQRYPGRKQMPYEYEIVCNMQDNAEVIYDLEHQLHRTYKQQKYKPLIHFDGFTECFTNINHQLNGNSNLRASCSTS